MTTKNLLLATALIKTGLTSKAAAQRANVSAVTFSLILNNRRIPKPETAQRIAEALGAKPNQFGWGAA